LSPPQHTETPSAISARSNAGLSSVPDKTHSVTRVIALPFNFSESRAETAAAFFEKIILRRNGGEIPESDYCSLSNPLVPRQRFRDGFSRIDLDPVALAGCTIREAKLQLATNVNQVGLANCFYNERNVSNWPPVLVPSQRGALQDFVRQMPLR
jgi:hypothetical protein